MFLTPAGHPVDGDNLRRRVFYRLLEQAGLRKIRLHDLRHTYASLLIQQGESLAYVQQQLGHSSVQVTVDVYGHLIPGANRAAVDRLDAQPARNPAATSANRSRTRRAVSGCKNWSRRADSNRGPADYESAALPAELRRPIGKLEASDPSTGHSVRSLPAWVRTGGSRSPSPGAPTVRRLPGLCRTGC